MKIKFCLNKLKIVIFFSIIGLFLLTSVVFASTIFTPLTSVQPVFLKNSFPVAKNREPLKKIRVLATAYSSDVWQTDSTPCISANGYDLCKHYEKYGAGHAIAANFLPFGAQVKLPELFGDKVFVVQDRMGSRHGYGRIDVWMPTREEAKAFGVKYIELELYSGRDWKVASK